MAKITIPLREEELTFVLPEHWSLQQVASEEGKSVMLNWSERMALALAQPGSGQSLSDLLRARPSGRIVVIVEDITRGGPSAEILGVLMKELGFARVNLDQVELILATGMHPPMQADEVAEILPVEAKAVHWRCNPCRNASAYVDIGHIGKSAVRIDRRVAEADLRILVSSVSPHFQAGFGGGYRLIVPGCAYIETIQQFNHMTINHLGSQLVGTESDANSLRSAIDTAGLLMDQYHGKSFSIQYLLDSDGQVTSVAAGEVIATQRMLAKQCSVACGIVTPNQADVLITCAYPRDFDLAQSLKCIANTRWAARPNGVVICVTGTRRGLRDISLPTWPLSANWTRRMVRLIGVEAVCSIARRLAPGLAPDAAPYFRLAAETLHRNALVMVAPLLRDANVRLPGIKLVVTMEEAFAAAEELLPKGTVRTIIFPAGGATFPVLPTAKSE
ncbi:MAG: DUF2088 domain-containing protein [Planctomycetes bacterium]|nr:DUF2088 domain-containing protein [Planctomycetota bacterium]